jgi:hypothetical protein
MHGIIEAVAKQAGLMPVAPAGESAMPAGTPRPA